jgi:acyl carrier protein
VTPTAEQIQDWIVARVAATTGMEPREIDPHEPFTRHGLDSVALVTLAAGLEKWLGYRFRSNPFEDHPTVASLSRFLAEQVTRWPKPGSS